MEHEDRPVDGVLGWLDGPRLVIGAFAFFVLGLAVLGVLLWSDSRNTQKQLVAQVARIDELAAANRERSKASNQETVNRCFSSAAQGPSLRRILLAIERETMDAQAKADLQEFIRLNALNTPTVRECRKLANDLNVPVPKGVTG